MHKILTFLFVICAFPVSAQFFNPYAAYQYGVQLGQQLAKQQQEANERAYKQGYAMGVVQAGHSLIATGDYKEALDNFEEAFYEYDYIPALSMIGLCYELGIGCDRDLDWADTMYETGAGYNDISCKLMIKRINENGHYSKSYRETYLKSCRANYQVTSNSGGNVSSGYVGGTYVGTSSTSSTSSGSTSSTCRICGGSGTCTSCHGSGGEWRETGYYTGSNSKSWFNCPSCNGNKRCFNCHGTGKQ